MSKPVMIEGVHHRMRRGKLVVIPAEWLGKVTSRQTINKRQSKHTGKARRLAKHEKPEPRTDARKDMP